MCVCVCVCVIHILLFPCLPTTLARTCTRAHTHTHTTAAFFPLSQPVSRSNKPALLAADRSYILLLAYLFSVVHFPWPKFHYLLHRRNFKTQAVLEPKTSSPLLSNKWWFSVARLNPVLSLSSLTLGHTHRDQTR